MTGDRRRQVESPCLEALAMDGERRAAFLEEACGKDTDLRRDVESLVAGGTLAASLLESPPWAPPPLAAGQRLGPYEILGLIGSGRDGRGLQSPRHAAGPHGGHQGAAAGAGERPGAAPPVRVRSPSRLGAQSPAHLSAVRRIGYNNGAGEKVLHVWNTDTGEGRTFSLPPGPPDPSARAGTGPQYGVSSVPANQTSSGAACTWWRATNARSGRPSTWRGQARGVSGEGPATSPPTDATSRTLASEHARRPAGHWPSGGPAFEG